MKIERKEENMFEPITITLETVEEAEIMKTIMQFVEGDGGLYDFTSKIWAELRELEILTAYNDNVKSAMIVE